ncbi:uncharacterized protein [Ptychodera flava]|uniref:uncharacterized protein n=1 Tax=Ptychodera flava TaxID=63121 RepID=UPI00396A2AB0
MSMEEIHPISIEWSIKGYHVFHICPHPLVEMVVLHEHNNRYDPDAMKVVMPRLEDLPEALLDTATRTGGPTVRQLAGLQVGRVPANLCRAFKILLDRDLATKITCTYTGEARQSQNPPVQERFQSRGREGLIGPAVELN